jgi:uncharacterized membrane protein
MADLIAIGYPEETTAGMFWGMLFGLLFFVPFLGWRSAPGWGP